MSTTSSKDFIDTMGEWFDKFPPLPKNWRDTLARISPVLALVFGILGILVAISGLGTLTFLSPLAVMGGAGGIVGMGMVSILIYLVASVLLLAAYPGLKAKKYSGWKLLFWSEIINLVGGVINLHGLVSAIIGALIGFYIIFQIRSYFK